MKCSKVCVLSSLPGRQRGDWVIDCNQEQNQQWRRKSQDQHRTHIALQQSEQWSEPDPTENYETDQPSPEITPHTHIHRCAGWLTQNWYISSWQSTIGLDRYHAGARYPTLDTIGSSCTDTDTDTGNDITYSLRQTYVTYIVHSVHTFRNITSLTSWTVAYLLLSAALQECISYNETNYRLETTGMHATVLTVKTGKWTTGIGADTKISIGRYRYPPILAGIGRYPIPVSV